MQIFSGTAILIRSVAATLRVIAASSYCMARLSTVLEKNPGPWPHLLVAASLEIKEPSWHVVDDLNTSLLLHTSCVRLG